MGSTHRRVLYGALAAACAALVALDASTGRPSSYPLYRKLFGEDWEIWRNAGFMLASVGAAFFGYLALNVKNGNGTHT